MNRNWKTWSLGFATMATLTTAVAWSQQLAKPQEPTTAQELKAKAADPAALAAAAAAKAADEARKAKMSPEELAWEKLLEENLGSFYLPLYKQEKAKGRESAWDYIKDDPKLPRVLLIGDSISRGYTLNVRHALAGKANVHRAPANCGSTDLALKKLPAWLGDGKWDLIHFNFGIHDRNAKPEVYVQNLETIIGKLQAVSTRLVWANSTPVPAGSTSYSEGCTVRLNKLAAEVMQKHNIPIDDLYAAVMPVVDKVQVPKDCHFKEEGYQILGKAVAECIVREIGGR